MYASHYMVMVLLIKDKYLKHLIWLNYGYYHVFSFVKIMAMAWVRVQHVLVRIRIFIRDANIFRVYGLMVWMFSLYEKQQDLHEIGVPQAKVRWLWKWRLIVILVIQCLIQELGTNHNKIMFDFDIFFYFSYRTREEIQDVRKSRDPITSFREKVIQAKLATEEEFKVKFPSLTLSLENYYFFI